MNATRPFFDDAPPPDMHARISYEGRARGIGERRRKQIRGKRLALIAAAFALPAMANEAKLIDIAPDALTEAPVQPMAFEIAGQNFPGSAFYYLEDEPYVPIDDDSGFLPDFGLGGDDPVASENAALAPLEKVDGIGHVAAPLIAAGGADTRSRAMRCLTMAVYYEAASEPDAGQRAVAQVVLNRVAHRAYPNSVCGVVFQGSERRTGCQFSFTCDGSLRRKPSATFWARAQAVARSALGGAVYRPVGLATHYHTTAIHPYWAPSLHHLGVIGAHRFYTFPGAAGRPAAFRFAYAGYEPAAAPKARSAIADPTPASDPIAVAKAYEASLPQQPPVRGAGAQQSASQAGASGPKEAGAAKPADPAPTYSDSVRERGGESLFSGEKLPSAGAVKPEYANSGQWLDKPKP